MLRKTINIILIIMLLPFNSSYIYLAAGEYNTGCDRLSSGATTNANCDQLPIVFENNSFEELDIAMPGQGYVITDQDDVPGWDTTSTDGKIEVWTKGFYDKTVGASGNWGITGDQFVEINATQNAALYQDFATEPGQVLKIYLNHGGRSNGDSMNVVVGAPSDNTTPTKPTIGGNNDVVATDTVNKGEWSDVAVEYIVPEGQTTTRIAFVSAGSNHYSGGNFIDNVHVGIDSVYDNSIEILAEEQQVSFADSFTIVNHLQYESGAYLGKFKLVIDTENFTNLRNPHIYSASGVELPLENATYENDTITITGDYFEEGYVTFEADSTLQGSGTLEINSTLNYLSLMDVALIEAGIKELDSYYWVNNSTSLEVINKSPEFTAQNVTIDEGSSYTEAELLTMLDVSVFDLEDDKLGLDLSYTNGPVNVDQNTPGVYDIEFTATDSLGEKTVETFSITVADVAPEISLEQSTIELKVGSNLSKYPDEKLVELFGATATEINSGDLTEQITVNHQINPAVTGQYPITFNVTDNDGTSAQEVQATVLVVRTFGEDITGITPELNTAPVITAGNSHLTISEEIVYSDEQLFELFDIVAADTIGDVLTLEVDQSQVNYSVPGTYPVSFKVTDSGKLSSTTSVSLTIEDTLPVITAAVSDATINLGEEPTDAELINLYGIVATEITDGDLTSQISVETNVNVNVTGKYFVVFTVTDQEGNIASTPVDLKVMRNIIDDINGIFPGLNTAPKITANTTGISKEGSRLSHEQLIEVYRVTISDAEDETANLELTVDDSQVNYTKPGVYDITFTVTDTGNLKSSKTVKHEIADALPVITSERDYAQVELNADLSSTSLVELFGIKATELETGDLTSQVTTNAVNSNKTGHYPVTFLVADDEGNVAAKTTELRVVRNLDVEGIGVLPELNTAPKLSLNNKAATPEETQLSDEQLVELFAVEISDAQDQTSDLQLDVDASHVDYSKPGKYPVRFKVTDSENLSKEHTAVLNVQDIKPVIAVERNFAEVTLGDDVSLTSLSELFKVSASEITNGDLTQEITVTNINSNVTGTYPITFTVSDEEGNSVSKTVSLKVIRDLNDGGEGVLPELNTAPHITVSPAASTSEETRLTDAQLIELFAVELNDAQDQPSKLRLDIDASQVDYSKPGTYPVVFKVTDSGKLTTQVTVNLTVQDIKPVIEVERDFAEITLDSDVSTASIIQLFNASASESTSGDLTQEITATHIKSNVTGTYPIEFTVSDEEGNKVTKTVLLNVVRNQNDGGIGILPELNTAPIISAVPVAVINEEISLSNQQLINLFEVQVNDAHDTSEKLEIAVDFSAVNPSKPGTYPISFSVTDSGQLTSTVATTLVIKDLLPTIELTNEQINLSVNQEITKEQLLELFGATASEITSEDLNHQIEIDGEYQNLTFGSHEISLNVSDEEGNEASAIGIITVGDNTLVNPPIQIPSVITPINKPTVEVILEALTKHPELIITAIPFGLVTANPVVSNVINKAPVEPSNEFEWVENEDELKTITQTKVYDQLSDNSLVIKQYAQDLAFLTTLIVLMIAILLAYKIFKDKTA
ncbi:DUF5011 domain-containing protein [Mollicutes bacterium LVI A0039]|nr:DUF5011 domain-containing protein [Mollicutes bacterium LVI A0039]